MKTIASGVLPSGTESDFTFISSDASCRACHSSNHITLKCHHLKQEIQFDRAKSRNYERWFETKGDHRR